MANARSIEHPPCEHADQITDELRGETEKLRAEVKTTRYSRAPLTKDVRRLSVVNNWYSAGLIMLQWVIMLGAAVAAVMIGHWLAYVVACFVIASRLQALGVIMHDAAHYLLFTNRTVNDIVGDLFVAFPVGFSLTLYRHFHFQHHRFTNTEDDPDLQGLLADDDFIWPKTKWQAAWLIFRSTFAFNVHRAWKVMKLISPATNLFTPLSKDYPLRARILYVATSVISMTLIISSGHLVDAMILFGIPGITMLNVINRIRATAEHLGTPWTHELNSTRTVIPTFLERIFIAPYNVNYHLEHHLFPSVPGRHLPKLHRLLMEDEEYRSKAHITHSYWGVLRELMAIPEGQFAANLASTAKDNDAKENVERAPVAEEAA